MLIQLHRCAFGQRRDAALCLESRRGDAPIAVGTQSLWRDFGNAYGIRVLQLHDRRQRLLGARQRTRNSSGRRNRIRHANYSSLINGYFESRIPPGRTGEEC